MKKPLLVFLFALLVVRLLPELGLQFYDEGTDSYYQVAIEGLFTATPESLPAAWGKWTFISNVHQMLYELFPHVNWYSVILLVLSAWSFQLFVSIVQNHLSDEKPWQKKLLPIGLIVLLGIIFWENIFLIQFTRIAQFLCLFGLLNTLVALQGSQFNWKLLLNGSLAFVVGTMIRLEPGLLAIGLVLPYLLSLLLSKAFDLKKTVALLVVPLITCIGISYLINNGTTKSDDLTVLHNKFLHNTDGVKYGTNELNIDNKSDSLAYSITFAYFMNDPVHINQEFTDRIGLQPFMSSKTLTDHITRIEKFKQRWNKNLQYLEDHAGLALLFFLMSLSALLFPSRGEKRFRIGIILTIIAFVSYYVVISGYMKMDHHVFIPLLFCFSVILVLLIGPSQKLRSLQLLILVLVVGSLIHEFRYVKSNLERKQLETKIITDYLQTAKDLEKKYMVFDMRTIFRLYTKPFQKLPISNWSNSVSFDNGLIFVLQSYSNKLESVSGSMSLEENWLFFAREKDETIFLGKGARLEKVVDYFNLQYGMNMTVMNYSDELRNVYDSKLEVKHDLGIYTVSEGRSLIN